MLQTEEVTAGLNEFGFDIVQEHPENNTHRLNTLAIHHEVGQGVSIQAFKPHNRHSSTFANRHTGHNPRLVRVTILNGVGQPVHGLKFLTVVKPAELKKILQKVAQGHYKNRNN